MMVAKISKQGEDTDNDNDGVDDDADSCVNGLNPNVFNSDSSTDHDGDGCEDDNN